MIPVIIICHGNLAVELKKTAELIIGSIDNIEAISFAKNEDCETLREKLDSTVAKYSNADGIIIFTDIFGGSCTNVCNKYLDKDNIEIIAGVNLSILLETITMRTALKFHQIIDKIRDIQNNAIIIVKDKIGGKVNIKNR